MRKKMLVVAVIMGILLAAMTTIIYAQDIELLEVKYREIERSERYVTVAWLVKAQNNTDTAKEILVKVQFIDNDGFELESGNEWTTLQPGTVTTITDTIMISVDIFPQIAAIRASF